MKKKHYCTGKNDCKSCNMSKNGKDCKNIGYNQSICTECGKTYNIPKVFGILMQNTTSCSSCNDKFWEKYWEDEKVKEQDTF